MKSQSRASGKSRKTASPKAAKPATRARAAGAKPAPKAPQKAVDFSNVDKVMFPEPGFTKGDLLTYYLTIAPWLLPHLRDRPVTLERLPDGVREGSPRFWQKNTPDYYPEWITRINFPNDDGKPVHYAIVNDEHALAYLVNQGTITFHTWFSRTADLDRPDFVVFDLDPGTAPFGGVITIARTLRVLLEERDVPSAPKTSGKSGLHIVVPWRDAGGYAEARAWALSLAGELVKRLPRIATLERSKAARRGRVYVDVMQNGLGKHAVPAYVVRPTPGATVSTPLEWKEVDARLDPKKFTIRSVPKRLKRLGRDLMGVAAAPARSSPARDGVAR